MPTLTLLALNSGSSSLKFGAFLSEQGEVRAAFRGAIDGIGTSAGRFSIRDAAGKLLLAVDHSIAQHEQAVDAIGDRLSKLSLPPLAAIGHRIVHGGPNITRHQLITPEVLRQLETAVQFAPLHIPAALRLIHAAESRFPGLPQFACLDTAFHRTMPEVAARFALPEKFWNAGVRRYGFHGLSCESALHALGPDVPARMIVAHLGNGASLTAIAGSHSMDTTMGLTPTGGIVMGTRCGDLDPGVLLHILRAEKATAEELENLVDQQSGLLGLSGLSNDMRQLHAAVDNPRAALAIESFAGSVKKAIAGFFGILEGLDLLVFTGGIGEHDSIVREKICGGLQCLGIVLDLERNQTSAAAISSAESRVKVVIIPADEEAQIARHMCRLLSQKV